MIPARLISSRLAAHAGTRQVEAVLKADAAADAVEASIRRVWRQVLALLDEKLAPGELHRRALLLFQQLTPAVADAMVGSLTKVARWGHRTAAQNTANTLPTAWMAAAVVEKADDASGRISAPVRTVESRARQQEPGKPGIQHLAEDSDPRSEPRQPRARPGAGRSLAAFPDYRQRTDYSCGASAFRAVATWLGIERSEADWRVILGTDPKAGTTPPEIVAGARRAGLQANGYTGLTIGALKRAVDAGRPVICAVQYDDPRSSEGGHWVVVIGYGPGRVRIHDPVDGQGWLPWRDFLRRWHDRETSGKEYRRCGIVVWAAPVQEPVALLETKGDASISQPGRPRPGPEGTAAAAVPSVRAGTDAASGHLGPTSGVPPRASVHSPAGNRFATVAAPATIAQLIEDETSGQTVPGIVGLALSAAGELSHTDAAGRLREPVRDQMTEEEQRKLFLDLLFPPPSESRILQLLNHPTRSEPWHQQLLRATKLASPESLASVLTTSYAAGKTQREIAKDLLPVVDGVRTSARRIARTECLPADSVVSGANVRSAFRRWYSGPMVKVVTKKGRELTGTPNHPVLTLRGWVALAELNECDDLVCDSSHIKEPCFAGDENETATPVTLGEIFDSLSAVAVRSRERTGKPDFHGDGLNGDVDILHADSVLRFGRLATGEQLGEQFGFSETYLRTGRLSSAGCQLEIDVSQPVNLVMRAESNSVPQKFTSNSDRSAMVLDPQCYYRPSVSVVADNVFYWDGFPVVGMTSTLESDFGRLGVASGNTLSFEDPLDDGGINAHHFGNYDAAQAGLVETDSLVSLTVIEEWNGHVFNLETEDGYYICNGLYTKNCTRIANAMQAETTAQLGDMVIGYQIHATLDQHTRAWHAHRNGTVYYINPKQGQKGLHQLPHPPEEAEDPAERPAGTPKTSFNCRCFVTPVMRPPGHAAALETSPLFTNPENKLIPDPAVYSQWFDQADERRRRLAVGAKRYSLVAGQMASGVEPSWKNFIDPQTGDLVPIATLKTETEAARAKRVGKVQAEIERRREMVERLSTFQFLPGDKPPVLPPSVKPPPRTPKSPKTKDLEDTIRNWLEAPNFVKEEDIRPEQFIGLPTKTVASLADMLGFPAKDGHDLWLHIMGALERAKAGKPFRLPIKHRIAEYKEGHKKLAKIIKAGDSTEKAKQEWKAKIGELENAISGRAFKKAEFLTEHEQKIKTLAEEVDRHFAKLKLVREAQASKIHKLLKTDRPVDWKPVKLNLSKEQAEKVDKAKEFIVNVTADKHATGDVRIHFEPIKAGQFARDHHLNAAPGMSIVRLSEGTNEKTVAHEWGHSIEVHLPGALEAAKEFLRHRVGDEAMTNLASKFAGHGYENHEEGRKDEFDKYFSESHAYYVGKDYGGRATEVISMGVEALYNDPVEFAKKDPEYCKFILGILDGHLR